MGHRRRKMQDIGAPWQHRWYLHRQVIVRVQTTRIKARGA